jgi:hypothetical protein
MEIGRNTFGASLAYLQGESGPVLITMPIPEFLGASGLGRSKTYDLINEGEIQSVLVGKRRLIIVQSYLDYLGRQKRAEENGIGCIPSPNPRAKSGNVHIASPATANDALPSRRRPRLGRPPKPRSTVRS